MQIDLSKYIKQKFTVLYDDITAKQIIRDYHLDRTYEDIEFIAPKEVLSVSRGVLRKLLEDRVSLYPNESGIKKSVSITTKDKGLKQKFKETLNELIKERKEIDTKLRIKLEQDERNDTNSGSKLLH